MLQLEKEKFLMLLQPDCLDYLIRWRLFWDGLIFFLILTICFSDCFVVDIGDAIFISGW